MEYKSPSTGCEISCVMHGINPIVLEDGKKLRKIALEALEKDDFHILDETAHEFQPKGFTFMALLAESHLAIHTYPEHNSMFFYIYSCRGKNDGIKTYKFVKEYVKPESADFKKRQIIVKQ